MAGASLFALLDDIATLLDDVAILSKVAAKKTAGVLGDDLALNANQVAGVAAERELPVVWAVAVGSFKNKAILVPTALAISAFLPWLVIPLLMIGGAYLCFEGVEKLAHKYLHAPAEDAAEHAAQLKAIADENVDMVAFEKDKIKGAIRTDFILSAEILVITLGTVKTQPFLSQVMVLVVIAIVMTVGVYGLVAGIVKLDDVGLWLTKKPSQAMQAFGRGLLRAAPLLMKFLSIAGTAAMFLVGGSILLHGIPGAEVWLHHIESYFTAIPGGKLTAGLLVEGIVGFIAGVICLLGFLGVQKLRGKAAH
jgi:uncharacterized protein